MEIWGYQRDREKTRHFISQGTQSSDIPHTFSASAGRWACSRLLGPRAVVALLGIGADIARIGDYGGSVQFLFLLGIRANFFLDSVSDKTVVLLISRTSLRDIVNIFSFCLAAKGLCSKFKALPCCAQLGQASSYIPILISH